VCGETFRVCAAEAAGKVNAFAGAADMNGRITDQHRERGNNFKIDQRLDAEAPDFFRSEWPAMPTTRTLKSSGAMMTLMRRRKIAPRTCKLTATEGNRGQIQRPQEGDENPSRQASGAKYRTRRQKRWPASAEGLGPARAAARFARPRAAMPRWQSLLWRLPRQEICFSSAPGQKFIGAERYAG